jgi:hypothetical protein
MQSASSCLILTIKTDMFQQMLVKPSIIKFHKTSIQLLSGCYIHIDTYMVEVTLIYHRM